MRILIFLFSLLSFTSFGQVPIGVFAASANYRVSSESELDNTQNTNSSNQQVVVVIGNSIASGTTPTFQDGAEPDYAQSVYESNAGVITEVTSGDLTTASEGSMWPALGNLYYKQTQLKMVFVNKGSPGSEVYPNGDNNNWYTSGTKYADMKTAVDQALVTNGTILPRMAIVEVGINDARSSNLISDITTGFHSLITRFQADYPGVPMFFINLGRRESGTPDGIDQQRVVDVRAIIDDLPNHFDNVFIAYNLRELTGKVPPNPDVFFDGLHMMQLGNDWAATMVFKYMRDNLLIKNNPLVRVANSADVTTMMSRLSGLSQFESDYFMDFLNFIDRKSYDGGISSLHFCLFADEVNARADVMRNSKPATGGNFFPGVGLITDGATTSGSIASNFTPSTDGGSVFTQNSGSAFVYSSEMEDGDGTLFGSKGTHILKLARSASGVTVNWTCNSTTNSTGNGAGLLEYRLMGTARGASTSQSTRSDETTINAASVNSTGRSSREVYIGAYNNEGTVEDPFQFTVSAWGFGNASMSGNVYRKIRNLVLEFKLLQDKVYVAIPDAPTFTDTHTLNQPTTGNGIQSADLNGKTSFYVGTDYPAMQFNVATTDTYDLMSSTYDYPENWAQIGTGGGSDYSLDEVSTPHGYRLYRLWFKDADNLIKKDASDTLGALPPIFIQNCIFRNAGFGGVLINQSLSGAGYGKFTASFLSFTGTGAERFYLGNTGNSTTRYMDTTRISHIYSDSSRREPVQLNNHRYVMVSNVTGRHVGIVLESPDQGIGQKNGLQCQGCGGGDIKNSIFESVAPAMIASTSLDLLNNRFTWSQTDRPIYLQDVNANGYAYKNVGDDTVRFEGNDLICAGYTLPYVIRIQEDDFVVVIKNNRLPPSATSIYTCDGPCPTVITSGNTFDSDTVPPVTFGDHPDSHYAPYWKVVTSDYDYMKGRGALTPSRP